MLTNCQRQVNMQKSYNGIITSQITLFSNFFCMRWTLRLIHPKTNAIYSTSYASDPLGTLYTT